MSDKIKLSAAIILLLFLGSLIFGAISLFPVNTQSKILVIESGDTARTIGDKLSDLGLIRSRFVFVELVRLSRSDRYLKKGTYVFEGRVGLLDTIRILRVGKSKTINITIPEGFSMYRTLKRIDASGLADFDDLYTAATDTAFVRRVTGFKVRSIEGFLYPETYKFDIGQTPKQILSTQVHLFWQRFNASGLTITDSTAFYKDLILASIVEKEAIYTDEKPIIAGVFLNRLRYGMRLASCPTVDYILERRGIKRAVLTYEDTNIQSPYNTYLAAGLPPTPISNPTISSLQAVRIPEAHKYLYFFADRKGRNVFSSSYEEHITKQQQYRRRG
jgi:UPF0755 protein